MKKNRLLIFCLLTTMACSNNNDYLTDTAETTPNLAYPYPIVDTEETTFYTDVNTISSVSIHEDFYGQDANYTGNQPSYTNNGDGTITDNVTGLMWEKDMGEKISYETAFTKAEQATLGEYNDWRVPTLKELYSLILFTGQVEGQKAVAFFIDTNYFNQPLGNINIGEREIDAQTWSSTTYVGLTMNGDETVFGVNFVDGRIKGYPKYKAGTETPNTMYFRMVRGNMDYGKNNFIDNGDGTISDTATGLMWQKSDNGIGMDWKTSLSYSENLELANYSDWRLPNAKELQSIVDYSRSPQTTNSPAIDPIFETTAINDPNNNSGQYPYFWTGTTHLDGVTPYSGAVYIAFGEGQGKMEGVLMDVHGAGCQRSDPKSGNADNYPDYFGPQGDVRYVYNYVRSVRNIDN
ncbi:DUF1566 domain-containing protein [Polaribacter sp. HaHaR_3_91]|uniref:Lcl C-terminal domain-containing protein n=1 Tax=Polaribacter sp. HaHaR_3_91 TaxID=2745561 RepID=UPI001C4F619C|nr:DUF1566 domain-containing protein [Polaribacter sp. HaHaR_3_91]QXP63001.1 DUF1566 domain-containing protein [Polaribacter sp. HaHaR_3_91]